MYSFSENSVHQNNYMYAVCTPIQTWFHVVNASVFSYWIWHGADSSVPADVIIGC